MRSSLQWDMPAQTRIIAVFSMPSFIAIVSCAHATAIFGIMIGLLARRGPPALRGLMSHDVSCLTPSGPDVPSPTR